MAEEENKLLSVVKEGILPKAPIEPLKKEEINAKTKEEMAKILDELKQKLKDIDQITAELNRKREQLNKTSPTKTEKLLQEIKVPPLEILK